jgi:hypothetical protein
MKYRGFLAAGLALLAPGAALGQPVDTGVVRWDALPPVRVADALDYLQFDRLAERVLGTPECRAAGYKPDRFTFDAPYAVLVEPDGNVKRIVIEPNTKCPGLDFVVGLAVQDLSRRHKFKRTGEARARWYAGRVTFTQSPQSQ